MNKMDQKMEKLYGEKANIAATYKFKEGDRIIIADTKRSSVPVPGTIGTVMRVIEDEERNKTYHILWDLDDKSYEDELDPNDLVDLFVEPELDIEIPSKFTHPFKCPNCGEPVQAPLIELVVITRDLELHQDYLPYSEYKGHELDYFEIYGGRDFVKQYAANPVCPYCREDVSED